MRRKKLKLVITLIAASFIFYFYTSNNEEYRSSQLDENNSSNQNDEELIEIDTSLVDRLFEDEVQNRLYLKQRRNSSTFRSNQKRVLVNITSNHRRPGAGFYLITEYTPVFGTTKYCRLKKDEQFRREYVKKRGSRYQLLEKAYETRHVSQAYDLLDKCVYKNCFFTCEHSLASHSDALLFHWSDLADKVVAVNQGDDYEKIYTALFRFERPHKQVWIMWDDEANKLDPILDKFKFNWTISYISSSEASYCSYGCLINLENSTSKYKNALSFNDLVRAEFNSRSNSAIWFVSNCKSEERMKIAAKLGEFYPITVFGGCGQVMRERFPSISTSPSQLKLEESKCGRATKCEQERFNSAKFYLSLENSNCSDYITEKFWKSLANDLIPIVMQPSREYYERIAPAHSFIHMADFAYDMRKLADYLDKVGRDFDLYKRFFEWKPHFTAVYDGQTLEKMRLCELCARLNNQHLYYNSFYEKVSDFIESACTRS